MISRVLFIGSIVLIGIWAIAFFGFQTGGYNHILLVIAIVALLVRLFYNKALLDTESDDSI